MQSFFSSAPWPQEQREIDLFKKSLFSQKILSKKWETFKIELKRIHVAPFGLIFSQIDPNASRKPSKGLPGMGRQFGTNFDQNRPKSDKKQNQKFPYSFPRFPLPC